MAQTTIAWSVLLERLARAGLTITNQSPNTNTTSTGWYVRLLDDSLDWDGPYSDPLDGLDQAVKILLSAYKDSLENAGEAFYWETPDLAVGDAVTVDGVRGSWTVTQLLDGGYARVRERLRGITVDVDCIRCIKEEDGPPRATAA